MKKMHFTRFVMLIFLARFIVSCSHVTPDAPETPTTTPVKDSVTSKAPTATEETQPNTEETACTHHYTKILGLDPTCTANGYTTHSVCTLCGEKKDYSILPKGHDFITIPEKPATDTVPGHTEYRECSRCHQTEGYVELAATHTHSLTNRPDGETNPLFFTCSCGFSVVSDLRSRPLIDQLTDKQYQNFLSLYNMLKNREPACTFSSSINQAEANTFYYLLQGQCPELFLLEYENSSFAYTASGAKWNPDCMPEERFEEVCRIMIDTMIRWDADCAELDEVGKIQYMVHWMNTNTTYSSIGTRVRSLYGGIIDREIACVGYSQILTWALNHFEIPCMSVSGQVPSKNEGHMWNLVQLDGKWYQVDPGRQ